MNLYQFSPRNRVNHFSALRAIIIILVAAAAGVSAQQRLSRHYPAGKDVRLELRNVSGTITVETWAKDEIRITADVENRKATFNPRQTETGSLVIDIVGDN